tara:strand:+ start:2767 stop:3531 length:765 start_codon:yes stop_codon:yes gene_type:complete
MGFKDNSDCGKSYFRGNAENNMTWGSDSEIQWNSAAGKPSSGLNPVGAKQTAGGDRCKCACGVTITTDSGDVTHYQKCCDFVNKGCEGAAMVMPDPKKVKRAEFTDEKGGVRNLSKSEYRAMFEFSKKESRGKAKSSAKSNMGAEMMQRIKQQNPKDIQSLARITGANVVVNGSPSTDLLDCKCTCVSWSDSQIGAGGGIVLCCGASTKCGTFTFDGDFTHARVKEPTIVVTYTNNPKPYGGRTPRTKGFNGFI